MGKKSKNPDPVIKAYENNSRSGHLFSVVYAHAADPEVKPPPYIQTKTGNLAIRFGRSPDIQVEAVFA